MISSVQEEQVDEGWQRVAGTDMDHNRMEVINLVVEEVMPVVIKISYGQHSPTVVIVIIQINPLPHPPPTTTIIITTSDNPNLMPKLHML